jgi:hypothetical protein
MRRVSVVVIAVAGLLAAGCAAFEDAPLPRDHPANPEATETPVPARSKTLDVATAEPIRPPDPAATKPAPARPPGHEGGHGHEHATPEADAPAAPAAGETPDEPVKEAYICPMHKDVRSDRPGTCPKCGMKLVPEATHKNHK